MFGTLKGRSTQCMLVLVAAVAVLLFAACGDDDDSDSNATAAESREKDYRIEFAMVGVPGVKFGSVIRNGAEQAGKDLGVEVVYNETADVDFPAQARLIRAVIAKKPDALVVANYDPKVTNPPLQEAVDAGIPVMLTNAGLAELENVGAHGYVGLLSETNSGMVAGQQMKDLGVTKLVCFNPDVGSPLHDQRCQGLSKGFGSDAEVIGGDLNDRTKSRNAVKALLQRDDSIDGIFATDSGAGEEVAAAVKQSGKSGEVKVGTFDLSPTILDSIKAGDLAFTLDQQQWLQGYIPVQEMTHMLRYGFKPAHDISTGPTVVTEENAEQVTELSKKDIR